MGQPKFIRLNDQGNDTRVSVSAITRYFESDIGGSRVCLAEPHREGGQVLMHVTETPDQIDALLGVTGGGIRDAAPDLLDALDAAIEALKTAERHVPEDGNASSTMVIEQATFEEAINRMVAAIAKARGVA